MLKLLEIIWRSKEILLFPHEKFIPRCSFAYRLFAPQTYHNFPLYFISPKPNLSTFFFQRKHLEMIPFHANQWCLLVVCCFPFTIDCLCSLSHILFPPNQFRQNTRDLVPPCICSVWGYR